MPNPFCKTLPRWTIRPKGRRARHTPGVPNRTEAEYAAGLTLRRAAGEIVDFWFEAVTLKLADDTRYTPDFLVMLPDGTLEFHEIKGHWEDDAKVKVKVAAQAFPFAIRVLRNRPKRDGGGFEEIGRY